MSKNKDFVKLEHKQCPVCRKIHNHNCGILIKKNLTNIKGNGPNGEVITGRELCEEHDKLYKEGYVALVVIDNGDNLTIEDNKIKDLNEVNYTGDIAHMKFEMFRKLFKDYADQEIIPPVSFIDEELFQMIHVDLSKP